MKPGTKADNQLLSEAYNQMHEADEFDMAGETGLGPLDDKPDLSIPPRRDRKDGGASAQEMNAWRQVVDGLRSGRIGLKEVEQGAGTIVVSTGDEKSVILKVMGFEDDHDVPVSMRPDRGPDN